MKIRFFVLFTSILAGTSAFIYEANQQSTQLNVSIIIKETCNITTANSSDLDFGSINRASTGSNQSSHLAVNCTQGTPYSIALQSQREMTNVALNNTKIPYTLYQDANRTTLWGADTQNAYSNTGTGNTQKIPVWGQVNQANTNVPAGQYTDKVTAVITY